VAEDGYVVKESQEAYCADEGLMRDICARADASADAWGARASAIGRLLLHAL
jgi:hypothetical protein